jgi:hypothetical protein
MSKILKGPKMRNLKDYQNPEILNVNIDNIDMYYNKINLKNNLGKLYIYHMYNCEDYNGRYYDLDFDKNKLKIKKNTIIFKIDNYEDEVNHILKTVKIKITLSDVGVKKMQNFLNQF